MDYKDDTLATILKSNMFKCPFHIPRGYIPMSVFNEDVNTKRYME